MIYTPAVYTAILRRLEAGQAPIVLVSDNPAPVASTRPPPVLRLVVNNP